VNFDGWNINLARLHTFVDALTETSHTLLLTSDFNFKNFKGTTDFTWDMVTRLFPEELWNSSKYGQTLRNATLVPTLRTPNFTPHPELSDQITFIVLTQQELQDLYRFGRLCIREPYLFLNFHADPLSALHMFLHLVNVSYLEVQTLLEDWS
jgi:hypothetical protein